MKVKHLLLVTLAFQLMFKNKKFITDFSEIAFPKHSHPTRVLSITHRVKFFLFSSSCYVQCKYFIKNISNQKSFSKKIHHKGHYKLHTYEILLYLNFFFGA